MTLPVLADLLPAGNLACTGPRRPGRPKTRTPAMYAALLELSTQVRTWFCERYGRPPDSDRELFEAFHAAQLSAQGLRASRATAPEAQRQLKTLRNRLSEARSFFREPSISGTPDQPDCTESTTR